MRTRKPLIFTYFKDAPFTTGSANKKDLMSLWAFQEKLDKLGHFYTTYKDVNELKYKFNAQLDKLLAEGLFGTEHGPNNPKTTQKPDPEANLTGDGAIARGPGAKAVGAGGVLIGGNHSGDINTGTRIDTGGGAYVGGQVHSGGDFVGRDRITFGIPSDKLEALFADLSAAIRQQAPVEHQTAALQNVEKLKSEIAKGREANDKRLAKIVDGLAGLVPGAVAALVTLFATPILQGLAGPATDYVLDKLQGK